MVHRQRRIEEIAYLLWEQEGKPHGHHDRHWQEAERRFEAENGRAEKTEAGEPVPASAPEKKASSSKAKPSAADAEKRAPTAPAKPAAEKTTARPAEKPAPVAKPKSAASTTTASGVDTKKVESASADKPADKPRAGATKRKPTTT
jgi:hypothetical protein